MSDPVAVETESTPTEAAPVIAEQSMGTGDYPNVRDVIGPDCVKALLEVADFEFYEEETEEAK